MRYHLAGIPDMAALRNWSLKVGGDAAGKGSLAVQVRATSNAGATQGDKLKFNPSGHHHNVIQTITLTVA